VQSPTPPPRTAPTTPGPLPVAATSPRYEYKIVPLAEGVYAFVAAEAKASLVTSNSLLVVGDDGALVFDTGHFPSLARKMIGDIRRLTPQPVRYVVTSHWHTDHLFGNAAFREAFPHALFVAHAETRRLALAKDPLYVEMQRKTPELIERYRRILATGEVKPGVRLSDRQRVDLAETIPEMEDTIGDTDVSLVAPEATFEGDGMSLYLGKREVRILHLGRGNTAGTRWCTCRTRTCSRRGTPSLRRCPTPTARTSASGKRSLPRSSRCTPPFSCPGTARWSVTSAT
jgi:glyoxylase-like metal-dependent hydrolase (beta-lactamase superfamily II)